MLLYADAYVISPVLITRRELTAEASLAAILERMKLGMAMAAMINMIATTINNSIRENPFCRFIVELLETCASNRIRAWIRLSVFTSVRANKKGKSCGLPPFATHSPPVSNYRGELVLSGWVLKP